MRLKIYLAYNLIYRNKCEKKLRFKKKLRSKIKEFREEKGLTQTELAERIGVSRQTIYSLEKGDYNPSLTLSLKIAEVLNKPLNNIFFLEPVIKIKLESLSLKELKLIAQKLDIEYSKLITLADIDEKNLPNHFNEDLLRNISKILNLKYSDIIEE